MSLNEISRENPSIVTGAGHEEIEPRELFVNFENENLNCVLKVKGKDDKLVAVCPDLITVTSALVLSSKYSQVDLVPRPSQRRSHRRCRV